MKHNDVPAITHKITPQNYENLFNVYHDSTNDIYFYNLLRKLNFPSNLNTRYYFLYTVKHGETWPGLAWKFYKNVKLWWSICAVNNIRNPVNDPIGGTVLKILSINTIKIILSDIGRE